MPRLDSKVAFITGAARGQGRSHAVRLAEEGAAIIAVDICESLPNVPYPGACLADLEETVRLVEAVGGRILARQADVRDYSALAETVKDGAEQFGSLDIIIANAGIVTFSQLAEMGESEWDTLIAINLGGVWRSVKAGLPHITDGGSVIIISSTAGLRGAPDIGHYSAAKHGVVGLMRSFAQELGGRGIRVNCIHPTQVDTHMIHSKRGYELFCPDVDDPGDDDFVRASQAGMMLPIPWVDSRDISEAVLFLATDASRYITGSSLVVDAGASQK